MRQGDADGGSKTVHAVTADWEPASGVEEIAGVVADVGQAKAGDGTVVSVFEGAFIFERERGRRAFGQAVGEWDADGEILGEVLGVKRFIAGVKHAGDTQGIVELEDRDV